MSQETDKAGEGKDAARPKSRTERTPRPVPPPVSRPRASASSDPAVHQVLAEIQTARANGDAAAVERLTARLGELGYE